MWESIPLKINKFEKEKVPNFLSNSRHNPVKKYFSINLKLSGYSYKAASIKSIASSCCFRADRRRASKCKECMKSLRYLRDSFV